MSHLEDADKLRRSIERGDPQPTCAFTGQRMSEPTPTDELAAIRARLLDYYKTHEHD